VTFLIGKTELSPRSSIPSDIRSGSDCVSFHDSDRLQGDASDVNGNTLSSSGKHYTYDFLDRLQTATGGITLAYDGNGQRVAKTIGGVTTRYLIDDLTPTGYAQVAEELVAGAVTKRYVYGPMRISMATPTTTSFYLYNGGGSVRGLADSAGVVTDTWTYDAFGNTVARTGTTANDMLYRGEQFDADLGFYYLRARWYDPVKGRFLSADKYEGDDSCCWYQEVRAFRNKEAATSTPHHLFSYTDHDPIAFVDPSGHSRLSQFALLTAIINAIGVQNVQRLGAFTRGAIALGDYAKTRALFLQDMLRWDGPIAEEMRTAATAVFRNPKTGEIINAVAVSGNNASVQFRSWLLQSEILIEAVGRQLHAEMILLEYGQGMGYEVIAIGSGKPICSGCTGALTATSINQLNTMNTPIFFH
jgi:RHS repeat-associated protein